MTKDSGLKKEILNKGWALLKKNGRDSLRIRELSKMCDCSVGTVYNLFANIDEIVLHLNSRSLDKMYTSIHRAMEKEIEGKKGLEEVFHAIGKAYMQFGMKNPNLWRSIFENLPIDPIPEWYRENVQKGIQIVEKKVQDVFGIKPKKSTQFVNFFWAAMHGMTSIMLNKKMDVVSKPIREKYFVSYVDSCLHGFLS